MKTKYNKSEIMSKAWQIFRGGSQYSYSFSDSLSRAWEIAKEDAAYRASKEEVKEEQRTSTSSYNINEVMFNMAEMICNSYRSGVYSGD